MGDPVIAAATLDRILHVSTTISIKGESYRLRTRKRIGNQIQMAREMAGGEP